VAADSTATENEEVAPLTRKHRGIPEQLKRCLLRASPFRLSVGPSMRF
jgi:hypothetical protein